MRNHKKLTKRTAGLAALGIVGVLALSSGATMAYFTDSGKMTNEFSTAVVDIDLVEPTWSALPDGGTRGHGTTQTGSPDGVPDKAQDLVQGRVVEKDPTVENHSTLDVYCYLRVRVPYKTVMFTDTAPNTATRELFSYTVSSGWEQLSAVKKSGYMEYVYGHTAQVAPGGKTVPLFTTVKYANVVEGQISESEQMQIGIDGAAIQAETFTNMRDAYGDGINWSGTGSFNWDNKNIQPDSATRDKPNDSNRENKNHRDFRY